MEKFCDLIKGDKPVFVIFYATWCPHCRKMLPIVSQLGKHKELIFLKYDIDDPANKRLVDYYQIQAVPLMITVPENNCGGRPGRWKKKN